MNYVSNLKFIKSIIKREVIDPSTGEIINDIEVVIKLKNIQNGRSRIHPLSAFLNDYRNNKPKYVSDIADDIIQFLNYIYFELNLKELSNIEELTIDIGANFLEQYSINIISSTVLRMDRNLTKFYYFLAKSNFTTKISDKDFILVAKENGKIIIKSIFLGKYKFYSKPVEKRPIHNFDKELIFVFLNKVIDVSPQIALGVYFQIFGGLRISEVISLEYHDISLKGTNGSQGMTLNILPKDLRPDLKSAFIRKPKRVRKQSITPINDLLPKLYRNHIIKFKSNQTNALFVNSNEMPMTDSNYRYYFDKAKNLFINDLINSVNIVLKTKGVFLKNQKWSTHFCRGLFSNMYSEVCNNIAELAVARGDNSLDASLTYITDTEKIQKKLISLMDEYYTKSLLNNTINKGEEDEQL